MNVNVGPYLWECMTTLFAVILDSVTPVATDRDYRLEAGFPAVATFKPSRTNGRSFYHISGDPILGNYITNLFLLPPMM